jgi:hypothetical protein
VDTEYSKGLLGFLLLMLLLLLLPLLMLLLLCFPFSLVNAEGRKIREARGGQKVGGWAGAATGNSAEVGADTDKKAIMIKIPPQK